LGVEKFYCSNELLTIFAIMTAYKCALDIIQSMNIKNTHMWSYQKRMPISEVIFN